MSCEKTEIERLTGRAYGLTPPSRYRRRLQVGHRARLWVAEPGCRVPEDVFELDWNGERYRLKKDGALESTLAWSHLTYAGAAQYYGGCERQRLRFFHPVRVLDIRPIPSAAPQPACEVA